MKLEIDIGEREVSQVDEQEIARRRREHIANVLVDDDDALSQFGISNRVNID